MQINWMLHFLSYGMMAAGLMGGLYLFLTVKMEMRSLQKRTAARLDILEAALQGLCARQEEWQADLVQAQTGRSPEPPRAGINLSKRAQVLRLHRRGESVPTIAAALGIPQKEVELLLKVQRLVLEQS